MVVHTTQEKPDISRRRFLWWCGWAGFWSAMSAGVYSFFRFMKPGVLFELPAVFRAGRPEDYPRGTVSEKWKKEQKVWVIHGQEGIYALISVCTHLACTPNWIEGERLFRCPCHGSVFTVEGDVVSGPAPEPLFRPLIKLSQDGQLIVGTGLHGIRLGNQRNREPERDGNRYLLRT